MCVCMKNENQAEPYKYILGDVIPKTSANCRLSMSWPSNAL